MTINFGGFQPQENPLLAVCQQHPECIGCPAIGGQPILLNSYVNGQQEQLVCETGRDKKPETSN